MQSNIDIAQAAKPKPIKDIARDLGLFPNDLIHYGKYKAKVPVSHLKRLENMPCGKLVLVTSMSPTPAGEGKTTMTVGLTQALRRIGVNATLCIREPSLGPVMGVKGGAAGGGMSQVLPMEDINLYFTGDIPSVSAANNLLAALIDNHIFQGNPLRIDPTRIFWKRVTDMNDRALRRIYIGLGESSGIAREDSFDITAASEVMAILCLANSYSDLKDRLGRVLSAQTFFAEPVTSGRLGAHGAMAALLRDAFCPNLVQTMEGGPAFVHGGPFANIAHGCNSVIATKMALKLSDMVVTEAGFGADLGAEKFFNIKCRQAGLEPAAAVLVATVRAIKHHGGSKRPDIEDYDALESGMSNLKKQIENVMAHKIPVVVALNRFAQDTEEEIKAVLKHLKRLNVCAAVSNAFAQGGAGAEELARKVLEAADRKSGFEHLYSLKSPIKDKIETISKRIYGAQGVDYTSQAEHDISWLEKNGYSDLPICVSKTQKSLSDDPGLIGRPEGFRIHVRSIRVKAGAGFIVVMTGKVLTMPGLPRNPAAESITIDDDGRVRGLF